MNLFLTLNNIKFSKAKLVLIYTVLYNYLGRKKIWNENIWNLELIRQLTHLNCDCLDKDFQAKPFILTGQIPTSSNYQIRCYLLFSLTQRIKCKYFIWVPRLPSHVPNASLMINVNKTIWNVQNRSRLCSLPIMRICYTVYNLLCLKHKHLCILALPNRARL